VPAKLKRHKEIFSGKLERAFAMGTRLATFPVIASRKAAWQSIIQKLLTGILLADNKNL
jgi:hypothetical protein